MTSGENLNNDFLEDIGDPIQFAGDLYEAFSEGVRGLNCGDLYITDDDTTLEGAPNDIAESLNKAHDLAVLAVFASKDSRSTVDDIRRGVPEAHGMSVTDIDAGIILALGQGTLEIERGGVLIHTVARQGTTALAVGE